MLPILSLLPLSCASMHAVPIAILARQHTTLPYVPRNSLKGAGSAHGVQWVGGFSHGGGRVRRGLKWVLWRVPDLAAVHYLQPGRGAL